MSYFILRAKRFATATDSTERTLYLLKKKDVPHQERQNILSLKCSSIQRVSSISELMVYLSSNTCDSLHNVKPYILKRVKWKDAIAMFEIDSDTDTTGSD